MRKDIAIIIFLWCYASRFIEGNTESGVWKNVVSIHNLQSLMSMPYVVVFFATTGKTSEEILANALIRSQTVMVHVGLAANKNKLIVPSQHQIQVTADSSLEIVKIFDDDYIVRESIPITFLGQTDTYVPQDFLAKRFNNHFDEASGYLEDFGVRTGIVNCFRSSDNHECDSKREDSNKVYFYRNGRFLTDLPLDTMFNVNAIVANILHLVLLQEVPLLQNKGEMDKIISHATGRQDILFGRVKAVGIPEDRAFIETAFAFNQKYKFIMATVNDHFGVDEDWEERSNSVWFLKCKETKPKEPCPVIPFTNAITVENLVVFIKGQELPNTLELSESSQAKFLHLDLPIVYLSGAGEDVDLLRTLMHTLAPVMKGNAGFILINRNILTAKMEALWNLDELPSCSSTCAYLKAGDALEVIRGEFRVDELGQSLKSFLALLKPYNMPEDEEEDEYETEELYSTSQETQDDPVEAAVFKIQMRREFNISATQQLTDKTFPEFIASNSVTFVFFTVRWNAVCLSFLESYQTIGLRASELTDAAFNPLARVECSDWPDVCALNNVTMYPMLKIFRRSVNINDYHGRLDETDVSRAYMLHSMPDPVQLTSKQEFASVYGGSYPSWAKELLLSSVVIGIYPEQNSEDTELFREVSSELSGSVLFIECTQECAAEGARVFDVHYRSIVTVKWEDPYQLFITFTGPSTRQDLLNFVSKSLKYILPQLTLASLPSLLRDSPSIVMLFHRGDAQSGQAETELAKVAAAGLFDGLPMTWIDTQEDSLGQSLLKEYALPLEEGHTQLLYLNRRVSSICWYPHQGQFSESLMIDWLRTALTGQGETCAAALRHREWTELVEAYDFLAYIEEDREAEPGHMEATTSGRQRLQKHHGGAAALQDDKQDNDQTQSDQKIPVKSHMHSEL